MKIPYLRKIFFILLAIILPFTLLANEPVKRITIADVGFATPESVEYNAIDDVYLVTNINGAPLVADGNGFISKLSPDGRMLDLKWIDGKDKGITLHAPKGAAIVGGNIFVCDIDQVQIFRLSDGKQLKSITIKGSTFLNGITPGDGNFVYVSDSGFGDGFVRSGTDAIYKVWANGNYQAIVKDKQMGGPNGILDDGGRLVVVTFASGEIFSIDRAGKRMALPTPPKGELDGLVKLKDGRFLLSSWAGNAIYAMHPDKTFSIFADGLDAPADLGVDTKRKRLLIPLFKQNKLVILAY